MQPLKRFLNPDFAKIREVSKTESEIVLEPLERGYGHTLGNALRRVLLSSIDGVAVTKVKIDGILHEYSVIDGVQEDVIDILLNIKNLAFILEEAEEAVITLDIAGPKEVTAENLKIPHTVELINPESKIATITQKRKLSMEIHIMRDIGLKTAVEHKSELGAQAGELYLDSFFSPIRQVSYKVDNARIGNRTDLDKLTIQLETNGTISPKDSVCRAALILHKQLSAFVDIKAFEERDEDEYKISVDPIYLRPVEDLELTVRSANCLKNSQIIFIGDLVQKTADELMKISNFGHKSLIEIQDLLRTQNLGLSMNVEGWPPIKLRNQE